jgi:hypothetical protein
MIVRAETKAAPNVRCASIAIGLAAVLAMQIWPALAQAQQDVQSTAEDVIRRMDLQTEIRRTDSPTVIRRTGSATEIPRTDSQTQIPGTGSETQIPGTGSPTEIPRTDSQTEIPRADSQTEVTPTPEPARFKLPSEVLWVVVAVALAVLLYSFRDVIPFLRPGGSDSGTEDESVSADIMQKAPVEVLATADELAAQGRYVEAMHVLLLRGLADLRARLDEPFADSLTSREILRSTRVPQKAREALRDVVGRVEWTYFGEHPAGHEDYVACRKSFDALEQALHGSAAA